MMSMSLRVILREMYFSLTSRYLVLYDMSSSVVGYYALYGVGALIS